MKSSNKVILVSEGLIKVEFNEKQTAEKIKKTRLELKDLLSTLPANSPVSLLVDIRNMQHIDAEGQLQGKEYFKLPFNRMAVIGGGSAVSKAAKRIIRAAGAFRNVKYFQTEVEALRWLHVKKSKSIKFPWKSALTVSALLLLSLVPWFMIAVPNLLALTTDFSYQAKVVSFDNFYDEDKGQFSGRTRSDTKFTYTARSLDKHDNVLTIDNTFDVRQKSGEPIYSVTRNYSIDRFTKKHEPSMVARDRTGYLFGPTDDRDTYEYWHANYDQPIQLIKINEEQIFGLTTNHYQAEFTADQTNELTNLPDVGVTRGINLDVILDVWIEPESGWLVKYKDEAQAFYYDLKTGTRQNPWNSFSNTYTQDALVKQVAIASDKHTEVILIKRIIPLMVVLVSLLIVFAYATKKIQKKYRIRPSRIVLLGTVLAASIGSILYWLFFAGLYTFPSYITPAYPGVTMVALLTCFSIFFRRTLQASKYIKVASIVGLLLCAVVFMFIGLHDVVYSQKIIPQPTISGMNMPFIGPFAAIVSAVYIVYLALKLTEFNKRYLVAITNVLLLAVLLLSLTALLSQFFISGDSMIKTTFFGSLIYICLSVSSLLDQNPKLLKKAIKYGISLWIAVFLCLFLLAVTGIGWQISKNSITRENYARFEFDAQSIQAEIENGLEEYGNALLGAKGLFDASKSVDRNEWRAYVEGLSLPQNYPGLTGLGFAKVIESEDLDQHNLEIQQEGFPDYSVRPVEPLRDTYTSIVYLEPFNERNQSAFGYDMSSEITRRTAMVRARDTGLPAMSGSVTLLQEITDDVQYGFLTYVPVYKTSLPSRTISERRNALVGYVYSPYRIGDFIEGVVANLDSGISFNISDTPVSTNEERVIYSSATAEKTNQKNLQYAEELTFAGNQWKVKYVGNDTYIQNNSQNVPLFILIGGLILSFGLPGFILLVGSSRRRAVDYAERLTTDLEMQRDEAAKLQKKQESILTALGDGVIVCNDKGKIELFNESASRMSGYGENEIIGERLEDTGLFINRKTPEKNKHIAELIDKPREYRNNKDIGLYTKSKKIIPIAFVATPVDLLSTSKKGLVIVLKDMTEQTLLDSAKEDFLSIASHQLQTPATAVKQYVGAILEGYMGKISKEVRENLEYAYESNDRQIHIVEDMLNVTRLESGRLKINRTPVDVAQLLRSSIADLKGIMDGRNQSIKVNIPKALVVEADVDLLRIVMDNLISNASKYTPDGGQLTIDIEDKNATWTFTITDNGVGMSKEELKKLFTKFGRIENSLSANRGGTGLGLYITKKIIYLHGGTIKVDSEKNIGTSFIVILPKKG